MIKESMKRRPRILLVYRPGHAGGICSAAGAGKIAPSCQNFIFSTVETLGEVAVNFYKWMLNKAGSQGHIMTIRLYGIADYVIRSAAMDVTGLPDR